MDTLVSEEERQHEAPLDRRNPTACRSDAATSTTARNWAKIPTTKHLQELPTRPRSHPAPKIGHSARVFDPPAPVRWRTARCGGRLSREI